MAKCGKVVRRGVPMVHQLLTLGRVCSRGKSPTGGNTEDGKMPRGIVSDDLALSASTVHLPHFPVGRDCAFPKLVNVVIKPGQSVPNKRRKLTAAIKK